MKNKSKWMPDKDIVKFYAYCDSMVKKSKFKGTFDGGDIASQVMMDNEGKTLEECMELVPAAISFEFKKEQKDTHTET